MSRPLPWSHSSIEGFATCPRQYEELKVLKNFTDKKNDASIWGDEFHQAAEAYINGTPFPERFNMYEAYVKSVCARPGTILAEQKYGLDVHLNPCDFAGHDVWMRGIVDVLIMHDKSAYVDDWKGLSVDTEIPTPTGCSRMGDLQIGDQVFGSDGKVCRVAKKSEVHNRPCYKVTFSDKSSVICDNVHLWKLLDGSVVGVDSLHRNTKIPLPEPIDAGPKVLPIDPYVFGLWLADGKHTSAEITKPDAFIWEEIARRGYKVNMSVKTYGKCPTRTVKGIRKHLSMLGVIGNKHIPELYMRASAQQRIEMLRGLMDGDGNVNSVRQQCIFTSCVGDFAAQVKELICSLGQRPVMNKHKARGFGLTVDAWTIAFKPQGINPFLLPRKADRICGWGRGFSWYRSVLSVEEIPSVPTQCIGVDSPDNTYLCTRDFIVTHNTGKNRKKDMQQLIIFALLVFYHHPEIETCYTTFHWLQLGATDSETFHREQIPEMWATLVPKLQKYKAAFAAGVFPPKPSGLCKKHCAVETCEYHGVGVYRR